MIQKSDEGGGETAGESRAVLKISNAFLVSVQIRVLVFSFVPVFRCLAICANFDIQGQ